MMEPNSVPAYVAVGVRLGIADEGRAGAFLRPDVEGQGVGGVVAADLVDAHLGGVGHEHADGIGSLEGQVGDGGTGRRAGRGLP